MALLGSLLIETRLFTEAEPLLRELLTIREKTKPDDWTSFNARRMLGSALLGQKKYADAELLLLKGYQGMKEREKSIPKSGGADKRIPEALDGLIELYTATNKPDEVKKWQAERAQVSRRQADGEEMTGIASGSTILVGKPWHSFRRTRVGMPSATLCVVFGQAADWWKIPWLTCDAERRGRHSYAERKRTS